MPTEREVQQDIKKLLEGLTCPPYDIPLRRIEDAEKIAVDKLLSQGYVEHVADWEFYRLTPEGWDYSERLLHPFRYWWNRNWFAVVVAAITAFTSVGSMIVNWLTRL